MPTVRVLFVLTHNADQHTFTHMRRVSLFVDDHLLAGLDALKAEYGTPQAENIRRAIATYLAEKGVRTKAPSKTLNRKRKRT